MRVNANTDQERFSMMTDSTLILKFMGPVYSRLGECADTVVRIAVGAFMVPHGAQKLFGMFGGYGLDATGQFFEKNLGYSDGYLAALSAGSVEFLGGIFLAAGFLTRISAGAIAVLLGVTLGVHSANGFFWTSGGVEYPLLWMVLAVAFWVKGGGAFSVDRLIGKEF